MRGKRSLERTADGILVTERRVAVGASAERVVTLGHAFDRSGTYAVGVNGVTVGTVTVADAATPTAMPAATPTPDVATDGAPAPVATATPTATGTPRRTTTAGGGARFGVAAASLAVALVALIASLRRR